jgi:tetratricopeptide (TPR) repeat protein
MRRHGLLAVMLFLAVWGPFLLHGFIKAPSSRRPAVAAGRVSSFVTLRNLLAREEPCRLAAGARGEIRPSGWLAAPSRSAFPVPGWSEDLLPDAVHVEEMPSPAESRVANQPPETPLSEAEGFRLARLQLNDAEAQVKRIDCVIFTFSPGSQAAAPASRLGLPSRAAGPEEEESASRGSRYHEEAMAAFGSGDWVTFWDRTEELALLPSARDASLYLEHLDGLGALAAGSSGRAAELFGALLSEPALPPGMPRELIEDSLEKARQLAVAQGDGSGLALSSLSLLEGIESSRGQEPGDLWSVKAAIWCGRAARRCFLGEASGPEEGEELMRLVHSPALVAEASRESHGANLEAFVDLISWASLELIRAERRGDLDAAVRWAEALGSCLEDRREGGRQASYPAMALRKAAELLEARGRARLSRGDPRWDADLREAGRRFLALAGAFEPFPEEKKAVTSLCERSARMFQLAGDDSTVIAVLSSLGSDRSLDASLCLARSILARGNLEEALPILDSILLDESPGRAGAQTPGPLKEEACLLRGFARLERSFTLGRPGVSWDQLAEADLLFCLENLSPLSWVSRAALYCRGLQVERRALEAGARGEAASATALFEATLDHFQRALAVEERPGSGSARGRVSRAWRILLLDRMGAIEERLGRRDDALRCLERIAAMDSEEAAGKTLRGQGIEAERSFVFFPPGMIEELTASAGYRLGDLALRSGDLGRAIDHFERALQCHGESLLAPWAHLQLATIFGRNGDALRSREELELGRRRLERRLRSRGGATAPSLARTKTEALELQLLARWEEACRARISELSAGLSAGAY